MIQIKYSKILIIGSGPSGYTSCIYLSRSNLNPILLTGNIIGGQLTKTNEIENWPGLRKNLNGIEFMNNFFIQIKRINVEFIYDNINLVNFLIKPFFLIGNNYYFSEIIIISCGSNFRHLDIKNEDKYLNKNISFCSTCDGNFYKNKKIILIGGGINVIENLLYLINLSDNLILINRNNFFKCEKSIFNKFLIKKNKYNFIVKLNTFIFEILGDDYLIIYLKIINLINNSINIIKIDVIFLSIGNKPNSFIFRGQIHLVNNNHIFIKKNIDLNFTCTNINGIYSSGDISDNVYKQAITSSGFGCMSAFDSLNYYNTINI